MRLRPAAIVGALLLTTGLLAVGVPTTAAASAPRCTITGTAGSDRLVGTRGNDVICGLGGNDRIFAGPGQDVVRGGPGADRIYGDRGHDWLYGEAGDDQIHGGPGSDSVIGGIGRDRLRGDGGDDRLNGGNGADWLLGGAGHDSILGGTGDDVCPYEPQDNHRTSCTYDRERPRLRSMTATPASVDVTSASRRVTFRARITDDTAISEGDSEGWAPYIGVGSYTYFVGYRDLERVSGSRRDGMWEASLTIPRGMPATKLHTMVHIRDVAGRTVTTDNVASVDVADSDPDTVLPEVHLLGPSDGATYDVSNADQRVVVRARVTDADSGLASVVPICLNRKSAGYGFDRIECKQPTRFSGTAHDGVWQAVFVLKKGTRAGRACVQVVATDRARPGFHASATCAEAVEYDARARLFTTGTGEFVIKH